MCNTKKKREMVIPSKGSWNSSLKLTLLSKKGDPATSERFVSHVNGSLSFVRTDAEQVGLPRAARVGE